MTAPPGDRPAELRRWVQRAGRRCLYGLLVLWLAFPCAVLIIWWMDCDLLLGTRGTPFYIQALLNSAAALCGLTLAALRYRGTERAVRDRAVLLLTALGIALLLFCGNTLCRIFDSVEEYHSFSSPDGTHTVVIMENVSLISGQVTLFERRGPLLYPRARIKTDDGFRPVCAGTYSLTWQDGGVVLTVFNGAGWQETVSVSLDGR